MARVMVVGFDALGEQSLMARLRRICGGHDRIERTHHLDTCDLLVIRDLPALCRTATRVTGDRPGLKLWIEAADGRLCEGRDGNPFSPRFDDDAIRAALVPGAPPSTVTAAADVEIGNEVASVPLQAAPQHPQSAPSAVASSAPSNAPATAADAVSGAKPVTRLLRQCMQAHQGHGLLSADGVPLLLLDYGHDHGLPVAGSAAIGDVARWLGAAFPRLVLEALAPDRFESLAAGCQRLPLHPLLWQTAQHSGHWEDLDRQLQAQARVRLLRWPDFRVLGRQHDGFRLCSLLLKKPCTVPECSQLLGVDEAVVRDFVHTAYLCGYAALEAPAPVDLTARIQAGASTGSLLARMWRSLRTRSAA